MRFPCSRLYSSTLVRLTQNGVVEGTTEQSELCSVYVEHFALGRHSPGWPNAVQSCSRAVAIHESDTITHKGIPIAPIIAWRMPAKTKEERSQIYMFIGQGLFHPSDKS